MTTGIWTLVSFESFQNEIKSAYLPYGHIKNIASNGAGHGHVSETFLGDNDTSDQIWYTRARR